jgi:hypothetical protein
MLLDSLKTHGGPSKMRYQTAAGFGLLCCLLCLGCQQQDSKSMKLSSASDKDADKQTLATAGLTPPGESQEVTVQKPVLTDVPLIPRQILFGNPDKAMARLSPDGKHLSYLAPVDGVLNIFVGTPEDPEGAKSVTADKKRGIRNYFWAYTSEHILYTQDKDGDENWHVYCVNLKTGKTEDLTPHEKVRAEIQEVSDKFPLEVLVGLNDRDPQYHDLYRINLATGERKLIQENTEFAGFVTDDEYRVRYASKMTPDGGSALFEPDGKGGWKQWQKIGMEDTLTTSPAGFDKSGKILYFMDSRGRDTGALVADCRE